MNVSPTAARVGPLIVKQAMQPQPHYRCDLFHFAQAEDSTATDKFIRLGARALQLTLVMQPDVKSDIFDQSSSDFSQTLKGFTSCGHNLLDKNLDVIGTGPVMPKTPFLESPGFRSLD